MAKLISGSKLVDRWTGFLVNKGIVSHILSMLHRSHRSGQPNDHNKIHVLLDSRQPRWNNRPIHLQPIIRQIWTPTRNKTFIRSGLPRSPLDVILVETSQLSKHFCWSTDFRIGNWRDHDGGANLPSGNSTFWLV